MKKKLFYEIMVFQILRKKFISNELTKQGLYFGQHHILEYINHNPGCKQTDLSTYLKVTPASIAVSTKRLEKAGFIEKQVDQENLRQNCLFLTEQGKLACDNMNRFFKELDNNALKDISVEEYQLLENLLDKMIYNYVGTTVDEIDLSSLLEHKCKEEEEHEKVN